MSFPKVVSLNNNDSSPLTCRFLNFKESVMSLPNQRRDPEHSSGVLCFNGLQPN